MREIRAGGYPDSIFFCRDDIFVSAVKFVELFMQSVEVAAGEFVVVGKL